MMRSARENGLFSGFALTGAVPENSMKKGSEHGVTVVGLGWSDGGCSVTALSSYFDLSAAEAESTLKSKSWKPWECGSVFSFLKGR